MRSRLSLMKAKVVLLCCSSVLALLVAEAALRLALSNSYYIWPPTLRQVFRPDAKNVPGISGESQFEINSLGLRGDELTPSHTYRILAIGGSTTECLYLDQLKTWPHLLQAALNDSTHSGKVWVGIAGMSGRNTRHHLIAMRYLPIEKMRIDAVVLLIGVNDFQEYLANSHSPSKSEEALLNETFTGCLRHSHPDDPFFKKAAIWRLLRNVKTGYLRKVDQNKVQDHFGKILETWREHRRRATEIRTELPDLTPGLEAYTNNVNQLINSAKQKSVRLILITQPTMWKPGLSEELNSLLWLGGGGDFQWSSVKPYYFVETLANGRKQYNDFLIMICRQRGV